MAVTWAQGSRLKAQGAGDGLEPPASSLQPRRGVFTIEYVVMSAAIVAALLCMMIFVKRALCGKWREVGDSFGQGRQYEPRVTR